MTSYSHSRISAFEQCRHKYKLRYIDRIYPEGGTIEAFMGSRVHDTLEKLYKDLKYQKLNTPEELIAFYNETWEKNYTDDIVIVKKEYTAENYKQMGKDAILRFYDRYKPFSHRTVLGVETETLLDLPDGNKYHVRIDRLEEKDGVYYVCDYKTSGNMLLQEKADEDKQLAMYSIWVREKFPDAKDVKLVWHMLVFDKDVESSRTPEQLKELHDDVLARIREIEACTDFPTTVSALCDYCDYQEMCPAFKHKVELEEKTPKEFKDDDGVKMVDEYAELMEKRKEINDRLEEIKGDLVLFSKDKGIEIVYGSDKKIKVSEYEKIVLPEDNQHFAEVLKQKGLFDEVARVNYQIIAGKIRKGEVDQEIVDMTTTEPAYRFSVSKNERER